LKILVVRRAKSILGHEKEYFPLRSQLNSLACYNSFMASKISKGEWLGLYLITGIIDIIQIIIDFFPPIGESINEAADIVIGILLLAYFQLRGVSMFNKISRVASLLGVGVLEEMTGGLAPAWILDVWYIHRTVKQEEVESQAQAKQEEMLQSNMRQPLNVNGIRAPRSIQATNTEQADDETAESIRSVDLKPLNMNGIRRPERV
jgi:hypothetical protein